MEEWRREREGDMEGKRERKGVFAAIFFIAASGVCFVSAEFFAP